MKASFTSSSEVRLAEFGQQQALSCSGYEWRLSCVRFPKPAMQEATPFRTSVEPVGGDPDNLHGTSPKSGRFAINILDLDGQTVANRFTQRDLDRFGDHDWLDWDGVPVLATAKAAFACELHADHDGGDHRIVVGRVTRLALDTAREPLLYLHGRYRRVHVG